MKKVFEIHQKITFIANEYTIFDDNQKIAGYAKQKRLAMREKFTLFSDRAQNKIVALSQARGVMDVAPTLDVFDDKSKPLVVLKKEFKQSLLSSTWTVYDPKMEKILFTITETNQLVAIFRRVWNFIPFASDFPFFIKFHFTIKSGDKSVGEYKKITLFRDHYVLNLDENHIKTIDERAWMVTAVLLDAMQSR